jgi:exosortase
MQSVADKASAASASEARRIPWVSLLWFTGLLILCYFPVLQRLVRQWSTDDDMGHGFFVPVVAAYIAWTRRNTILAAPLKANYWGIALIVWGAIQCYIGTMGAELFLQRSAIIVSVFGVLLAVGGMPLIKELLFPLLLLPFMLPIPVIIYNQITFPLQLFASRVAETTLGLLDIPVLRDGNVLELASQRLSVAEACSGIRSLLSLSFLSLVYGYFFDRRMWMRWVLLGGVIPIAILANSGRVTITGILGEYKPELAKGFFHSLEGWIIFLIAMVMMMLLHGTVSRGYAIFARRRAR